MTNQERGTTVRAPCLCRGRSSRCFHCGGEGTVTKKACIRCGGTGAEGPGAKCPDCQGHGYRELDNMATEI